ncbi:Glycosyl_transferase family 2 protein [Hexamita inflata]|uniref:Glycosyl transferase family 2 protein n=1 Tax=Hexamita inflata TaxID=28002 RepID=A0AA86U996_9EUKA|nr:Glycosyl transferase family 2 protein [Hexamita inflata]
MFISIILLAEPLVSIVIPIYNGQNHIQKCFENLQLQTSSEFEVIVVNDGSTDKTAKLLSKIKMQNLRIITHQFNKGLLQARNSGISAAEGKYILNLDVDDILSKQAVEKLKPAIKTDVDIIHFKEQLLEGNQYGKFDSQEFNWANPKLIGAILRKQPDIANIILQSGSAFSAHGKLIKTALYKAVMMSLHEICQQNIVYSEDFLQMTLLFNAAKSYVGVNHTLYIYVQSGDGAIRTAQSDKIKAAKRALDLKAVSQVLIQRIQNKELIQKNIGSLMMENLKNNCELAHIADVLDDEWKNQVLMYSGCSIQG